MRSLLKLCVDVIVANIDTSHIKDVGLLPPQLKSRILRMACKRKNLGSDILHSLLHAGVQELDLNESTVTDSSLDAVGKCTQLRTLDINCYQRKDQVDDVTTTALVDLFPNLRYLTALYLQHCQAVTDDVVFSIAQNCSLLSVLDIGGCRQITDRSLESMTESLLRITTLNISESQVTDTGVLGLVQGVCGKTVVEFHVDYCKGITSFAIEAITLHCVNLKILQFHGTADTDKDIEDTIDHPGTSKSYLHYGHYCPHYA